MKKLLLALLLIPSLTFAQEWRTSSKTDAIHDYKINHIYNKADNVLITCANQVIGTMFFFKDYVGVMADVDFVYRIDKDEPDELYDGKADGREVSFIDKPYFVYGLQEANKIVVRATTDYGASQMEINANGFQAALNKSPECLLALKKYDFRYEAREFLEDDLNFKLVNNSDGAVYFIDEKGLSVGDKEFWLFSTFYNKESDDPDFALSKLSFNCKKNIIQTHSVATFDKYGLEKFFFVNPNKDDDKLSSEKPFYEVKKYVCGENSPEKIKENISYKSIKSMIDYSEKNLKK